MHVLKRPQFIVPFAFLAAFAAGVPAAHAQDGAAPGADRAAGDRSRIAAAAEDFIHNVMIAKPEAAASAAGILNADTLDPADLADAIDGADLAKRIDDAFRRSREMAGVSDASRALETKLESGRIALARKVTRIEEAVKMLVGPMRGQMLARERLLAAGEYAVPALLRQLVSGRDAGMEAAATRMLIDMKRQAALPLALAIGSLDPAAQRRVAVVLGQLGYPVAIPALLDLAQSEGVTDDVKDAAMSAVRALGGTDRPAHEAYADQSYAFLTREPSLAAFPSQATQNFWRWTEFGGLAADEVSTSVYHDVMAMFMARRALELDASDERALACFIAADLRRESSMSDGTLDPLFAGQGRSARFYATAAGPKAMQDVLRIGLDLPDTGVIRSALGALRDVGGAESLIGDGSTPAVEALDYADRRVQFEAALTLASVTPRAAFEGSEQVVPTLAQAVRGGSQTFVGIITAGNEEAMRFASVARELGMTPLTAARSADEFVAISARNAGCDVVIISGNAARVRREAEAVRAMRTGSNLAILVVADASDKPSMDEMADARTVVIGSDVSNDAFRAGMEQLVASAMGGEVSSGDGARYVSAAIEALTRIGMARDGVYRIAAAEAGLVDALRMHEGPMRAMVAQVLAMVETKRAQRAIIDAALAASGDDQSMLLTAVAQSARRFGSQATAAQSDAVRELVRTATGSLGEAAAMAFGAMNLPSSEAVDLIVKARVPGARPAAAEGASPADAPSGDASGGSGAAADDAAAGSAPAGEPAEEEAPGGGAGMGGG